MPRAGYSAPHILTAAWRTTASPRRLIISCLALGMLAACTTPVAPDPCAGWSAIRPAPGETATLSPELRAQVLAHNLHGAEVCHWTP